MFKFFKKIIFNACSEAIDAKYKSTEKSLSEMEDRLMVKIDSIPQPEPPEKDPRSEEEVQSKIQHEKAMALYYMTLAKNSEEEARLFSLRCREIQNKIEK